MSNYLKSIIQRIAQLILGYKRYLFLFAIYQVYKYKFLKQDKELKYFIELIGEHEDGIVIDAGANIGYTAVIFSKYLPNAHVIAFEPVKIHSDIMAELCTYFKIKKVAIQQVALGNRAEYATMVTPVVMGVKKQGFSFIKGEVYKDDPAMDKVLEEPVYMSSLDLLISNTESKKIAAIKIDVENYELFVLEGAEKLIQQNQPIVFVELWENERKWQCIELMKRYGYSAKVLINHQLVEYKEGAALNYFFLPSKLASEFIEKA